MEESERHLLPFLHERVGECAVSASLGWMAILLRVDPPPERYPERCLTPFPTGPVSLTGRRSPTRSIGRAFGEINGLVTPLAGVGLVKLVRKDLLLGTTFRTFAGKRG